MVGVLAGGEFWMTMMSIPLIAEYSLGQCNSLTVPLLLQSQTATLEIRTTSIQPPPLHPLLIRDEWSSEMYRAFRRGTSQSRS